MLTKMPESEQSRVYKSVRKKEKLKQNRQIKSTKLGEKCNWNLHNFGGKMPLEIC